MGDRRFGDEGGARVQHQCRLYSGGIRVRGVQGGSHSVMTREAAQRVRAAKSSEFRQGKL